MSSLIPIATYNLNLQPFQPAAAIELEFPSTIRITSVALDPESVDENDKPSTLRMLKRKLPYVDDEDYDEDDEEEDEDDESDDEEEEEEVEEDEEEVEGEEGEEGDDVSDSDSEFDDEETEEYVICTLSPKSQYQQVVDITIQPDEEVYFIVTGSYPIHLAGNYVDHPDDEDSDEEDFDEEYDDDEYDLTPDEDEIYDLDDLEDASDIENKIEELVEEDNKKRSAEDDQPQKKNKKAKKVEFSEQLEKGPTGSDFKEKKDKKEVKKDVKKDVKDAKKDVKDAKKDAKESKKDVKKDAKDDKKDAQDKKFPTKTLLGGVVTEDRKVGKGQTAKSGNRVSIRYIGKLKNGKVFDKNISGKPFSFGLGKGECIKGFDLGVAGMAVGGERRVVIPAKMGYGSQALPGIPANSELTFDIKLVSLK